MLLLQNDKVRVIQTLLFVTGISTLLQTLFGTRLPSVMGGSYAFLIPTLTIINSASLQSIQNDGEVNFCIPLFIVLNLHSAFLCISCLDESEVQFCINGVCCSQFSLCCMHSHPVCQRGEIQHSLYALLPFALLFIDVFCFELLNVGLMFPLTEVPPYDAGYTRSYYSIIKLANHPWFQWALGDTLQVRESLIFIFWTGSLLRMQFTNEV